MAVDTVNKECELKFLLELQTFQQARLGAPAGHLLHTSSWRAEGSKASLARVHLPGYTRPYSVLLAQNQGYATHIRFREPRRKLARTGNWTLRPRKKGRRGSESEAPLNWKMEEIAGLIRFFR
ncbi:hypothetical protein J1605_013539 [Eschrichtius robustus]|uniref:Uncharacterized protein n=1 Tax=Eschrichtius robustus TaxID=9764 RepID=A0AB34GE17_ESCRO|nr:hypothetical protein J1605_013539 [Eschrichtius robustus]